MRYEIAAAKKDAIEKNILTGETDSANKQQLRDSKSKSLLSSQEHSSTDNLRAANRTLQRNINGLSSLSVENTTMHHKNNPVSEKSIQREDTFTTGPAKTSEHNPASRKHTGPDEFNNADPADFSNSEEEDDPAAQALNKQALLEWLTVADFTKEISLTKVAGHKFKLD